MSKSSQVRARPAAEDLPPGLAASDSPGEDERASPAAETLGPRAQPARWIVKILPHALVFLTLILAARGIGDGGFRDSDAARHAMDGVFIYDFVSELQDSLPHPIDYSLHYYAKYPSLGFLLHYPPCFAAVEAVFYAVFGISPFTARLTVVAFAVLAVVMTYKLMRRIAGPAAAALSAGLFISLPTIVLWSRMVMLELPTTAMVLAATYFFYRYVECHHRPSAIWAALLVVAAVMTKQTALFLVPAFGAHLLIRRRWDVFKHRQFWIGAAIIAVALVPLFLLAFRYAHYLTRRVGGDAATLVRKLWYVLEGWSEALSIPGLIALGAAALACTVWEIVRPGVKGTWLLVCLLVMFFLESVYLGAGWIRYVTLIVPIMTAFPALLLWRTGLLRRRIVVAACGSAVCVLAGFSYAQEVPVMRGHADAARQLVACAGPSPFVFFDGYWDGDMVFFIRQYDPDRRLYLLRGGKMLYTFASFQGSGYREQITTQEALMAFLRDYGIRAIAVEEKSLVDTEPPRMLRDVLNEYQGIDWPRMLPKVLKEHEQTDLSKVLRSLLKKPQETDWPRMLPKVLKENEHTDLAKVLWSLLKQHEDTAQFAVVAKIPITAKSLHTQRLDGTDLLVYEVTRPATNPVVEELTIPLVGLQRAIIIPLNGKGKPRISYLPWKKKQKAK